MLQNNMAVSARLCPSDNEHTLTVVLHLLFVFHNTHTHTHTHTHTLQCNTLLSTHRDSLKEMVKQQPVNMWKRARAMHNNNTLLSNKHVRCRCLLNLCGQPAAALRLGSARLGSVCRTSLLNYTQHSAGPSVLLWCANVSLGVFYMSPTTFHE